MKRPNILMILTDEQPVQTVSAYGPGLVETPNLDRLSQEGTLFQRAYTTSPVCTPARAGLFTGIYPHNTGAWANHLALGQDMRTIGHYFRAQGYRTAYIGKWHLDGLDYFGTGVCPDEFEDEYWYDGRRHLEYLGPEKANLWRSQSLDSVDALAEHGIDWAFTWGGQITDRALEFLAEAGNNVGQPWVLILSYDEPHHPWTCPPEFLEPYEHAELPIPKTFGTDFEGKPQVQREWSEWMGLDEESLAYNQRMTLAATAFVDSEIGRVLDAADGLENTYLLFTSDHGNQLGAHRLMWKGPWMYEESIRVPLMIRGPGVLRNRIENRIVSHIDILPTLMEFCDIPVPPIMDGQSFAELAWQGAVRAGGPSRAIVEFHRFQLDRDDFGAFYPIRCMVEDRYKLAVNLFDRDEFYDLDQDPLEQVNLIDEPEYAAERDRMHRALVEWSYVRRDAFRSPQWEQRPWSESRRLGLCKGKIRTTPSNGLGPEAHGYMTGLPIEYDFKI
ncbi:MAG: sulfatase-like hydrolase/transferase [Anaerolineae bacterium]